MNVQVTLTLPELRKGSMDKDTVTVRRLQEMLNVFLGPTEEGVPSGAIALTGEFGLKTEQAVKTFQRIDFGDLFQGIDVGDLDIGPLVGPLVVNGVVNSDTWTKLLTMWLRRSQAS
jgi:hypothetical protein